MLTTCQGDQEMKRIGVEDKSQIKQLLYTQCVLGVKDDQYHSFNGFQLWWYDKQRDVCNCCQSNWTNVRKKVERHSLDKAAKILWHRRNSLFIRNKNLFEDRKLLALARCRQ